LGSGQTIARKWQFENQTPVQACSDLCLGGFPTFAMTVTNLGCTCRATISESNEADLVIPHAARFLVGSAHGRLLQGHLCHWLHGAMRLKAGFVTR
jgi:hypothetical protein